MFTRRYQIVFSDPLEPVRKFRSFRRALICQQQCGGKKHAAVFSWGAAGWVWVK